MNCKNFKEIIGDRFKQYLGSTYKIMENQSLVPFANYKPAVEAVPELSYISSVSAVAATCLAVAVNVE